MKNTDQIINMLPAPSLRAKIAELDYAVPEFDLLRIAYRYAASFDEQIRYFRLFEAEGASEEAKENAKTAREHLEQCFADFKESQKNNVYELRIKETPDSYEERYLCATLEDALLAISRFYELYGAVAKESTQTRYRIVKRKIFDDTEPFDEDTLGSCEYRAGGLLYRVDDCHSDVCTPDREDVICEDCEKACINKVDIDPILPKYLKDGDVVTFLHGNGKVMFGYNLDLDLYSDNAAKEKQENTFISEYYIIPLYPEGSGYDGPDLLNMHQHIPAGLVERADFSELNEKQQQEYRRIERFVLENLK